MWEHVLDWVIVGFVIGVVLWLLRWARGRDGQALVDAAERLGRIDIPDRLEPALASGLNWALDRAIDAVEVLSARREVERQRKMESGAKLHLAVQIADSLTNRLGLVDLTGQKLAALIEGRLLERGMVKGPLVLSPGSG